jgi:hypothetical protein
MNCSKQSGWSSGRSVLKEHSQYCLRQSSDAPLACTVAFRAVTIAGDVTAVFAKSNPTSNKSRVIAILHAGRFSKALARFSCRGTDRDSR